MIRSTDLVKKLDRLDDRAVHQLYSHMWDRAMEMNPLRSWTLKSNPTREDLKEVLMVLPPEDAEEIDLLFFGDNQ